jgi:hypothetical protein
MPAVDRVNGTKQILMSKNGRIVPKPAINAIVLMHLFLF